MIFPDRPAATEEGHHKHYDPHNDQHYGGRLEVRIYKLEIVMIGRVNNRAHGENRHAWHLNNSKREKVNLKTPTELHYRKQQIEAKHQVLDARHFTRNHFAGTILQWRTIYKRPPVTTRSAASISTI